MTITKTHALILAVAVALGIVFTQIVPEKAAGESFTGTATNVVSATTTTVGPDTTVTLFERNVNCENRIVTTNEDAIMLSFQEVTGFGEAQLSTNAGHYQAGSTTVSYDSGLYGCGKMTALGLTATGTVTITETQ